MFIEVYLFVVMASLSEFQFALRENIDKLKQRDETINDLQLKLEHRTFFIDKIKMELGGYRSLVRAMQMSNSTPAAAQLKNPDGSSQGFRKKIFTSVRHHKDPNHQGIVSPLVNTRQPLNKQNSLPSYLMTDNVT